MVLRFCLILVLVAIVLVTLVVADEFSLEDLATDYKLQYGRSSACPPSVSYSKVTKEKQFIPASAISAGQFKCNGKGGKKLQYGNIIREQGLTLPSIVSNRKVSFFAGVESSTRVCGPWAFNASTISWYVFNSGSSTITDSDSEVKLEPDYVYLVYSHFSDLCVYRTLEAERLESSKEPVVKKDTIESKTTTRECFPHDATVRLDTGRYVTMKQLRVGDRVLASESGQFSEVFAFSHQDVTSTSTFLQITTETGKNIKLTPGHIIYINGEAKAAKSAREGDLLTTSNGSMEKISCVENVIARGLYNPQTLSGDIIVNDIRATTWTTALQPTTASSLLSPLRMIYRVIPAHASSKVNICLNSLLDMARSI